MNKRKESIQKEIVFKKRKIEKIQKEIEALKKIEVDNCDINACIINHLKMKIVLQFHSETEQEQNRCAAIECGNYDGGYTKLKLKCNSCWEIYQENEYYSTEALTEIIAWCEKYDYDVIESDNLEIPDLSWYKTLITKDTIARLPLNDEYLITLSDYLEILNGCDKTKLGCKEIIKAIR